MPTSLFALRATRPRSRAVESLGRRGRRVGLDGVLAALDHAGRACEVPGEAAGDGFTWDAADSVDPRWWPQGVAATRSGAVVLVGWYAKRRRLRTKGSRISVVDRTHPDRPRYGHVLLVTARRPLRLLSLRAVPVHAGGIAVLGDLLYVADTLAGVRVFRLGDITEVPPRRLDALLPWAGAGTRTLGRRPTGGLTTYGYRFVLPELLRLRVPATANAARLRRGTTAAPLRYSFLFIGDVDGRLSLVVGEYGRKGTTPRLARYPLDPATGLPQVGDDGTCPPLEVHERQPLRMQGVAVHGSTWYVTASAGEGNPGDLYVGAPGAFRRHRAVLPTGPEDLDWSVPGRELRCATEWPGHRYVFAVEASRWSGPAR